MKSKHNGLFDRMRQRVLHDEQFNQNAPSKCLYNLDDPELEFTNDTVTIPRREYNVYLAEHYNMKVVRSMLETRKYPEDELRALLGIKYAEDEE